MPRYARKPYQLGPWYLEKRSSSPAWHRCMYDKQTGTTKRISLGTTDFEEAKRLLDVWWADNFMASADDLPPSKVKLADVLQDYWANQGSKLRSHETTKIFIRYWKEWWGDCTVADVRPAIKQEAFREHLAKRGLAPNSVNRCLECGRAAIRRGWRRGVLSSAPFIQMLPQTESEPMGRPMTPGEAKRLFEAATQPHLRMFILIGLATGARPEAITDLTWERVDFGNGLIHLRSPLRKDTKKRRPTVKLPPALAAYMRENRQFVHISTRKRIDDLPFVIMFRGKHVSRLDTAWDKACKAAGLEGVTLYSLRHTVARYLRGEGVSLDDISLQLGHRVVGKAITERYTSHSPDYLAAPSAALNRLVLFILGNTGGLRAGNDNQAKGKPSGVRWK